MARFHRGRCFFRRLRKTQRLEMAQKRYGHGKMRAVFRDVEMVAEQLNAARRKRGLRLVFGEEEVVVGTTVHLQSEEERLGGVQRVHVSGQVADERVLSEHTDVVAVLHRRQLCGVPGEKRLAAQLHGHLAVKRLTESDRLEPQ